MMSGDSREDSAQQSEIIELQSPYPYSSTSWLVEVSSDMNGMEDRL